MNEQNEEIINSIQNHLRYDDKEMQEFVSNQRNHHVLVKASELLDKTIVIEVVEAHGCNSQHRVGDKFFFDGAGNLLSKYCPKKICIFALGRVDHLVYSVHELFYAGIDPNEIRFKRTGCGDIGLKCGGWGKIIMEIRMMPRKKLEIVQ
ncbi:MAG: hypothetical protein ACW99F_08980 [Candidatus Hodarchaeales archaeon]|jgi:uncharacterized repeat protein (TIGR04076 family)